MSWQVYDSTVTNEQGGHPARLAVDYRVDRLVYVCKGLSPLTTAATSVTSGDLIDLYRRAPFQPLTRWRVKVREGWRFALPFTLQLVGLPRYTGLTGYLWKVEPGRAGTEVSEDFLAAEYEKVRTHMYAGKCPLCGWPAEPVFTSTRCSSASCRNYAAG